MKEKKKKMPFWVQIALILLIGVIASLAVFFCVNHSKSDNADKTEETTQKTDAKKNEKTGEIHTVTFAYQDGKVIKKVEVKDGYGIYPPKIETDCVYRGWSGAVNNVKSNIEVHPVLYSIVETNLFYFDSVYVKEGDDFTLDLYVSGSVNFNSCDLEIEYDAEVMEYIGSEDSDICSVKKDKDGVLLINANSEKIVDKKTMLAAITFNAKEKDVYSSQVN